MHPSTHKWLSNPLFSAPLFSPVALVFSALLLIIYRYAVHAMLMLLSFVGATGGFVIFDDDTTIFLCSLAIYAILLAPFFSDYSRLASGMDIASARGFAMISIVIVLTAVFLVYEDLLGLRPFKLFQLTKKFLKLKRSRYSFPKLSMIAFAAAGATSLSFILPFYALPFVFLIAVCQVAMSMMDSIHERRTGIFWRLWA